MASRSFTNMFKFTLILLTLFFLPFHSLAKLPMSNYPECITICLSDASFAESNCPVRNFALNGNRGCLCQDREFMARYTDCIMNGPYCGSVRDDKRAWTKPEEEYYAWIYMMFECKEMGVDLNGVDFGRKWGIRRVRNTVDVTRTVGDVAHPGSQFGVGHTSSATLDVAPKFVVQAVSIVPQTTLFSYRPITTSVSDSRLPCSSPPTPVTSTIIQTQTTVIPVDSNPAGVPSESTFTVTVTATLTLTPQCAQFEHIPYTTILTTLSSPIFVTSTQALQNEFTGSPIDHGKLPDGGYGGSLPSPTSESKKVYFTPLDEDGEGIAGPDVGVEDLPPGFIEGLYGNGTERPRVGGVTEEKPVSAGLGVGERRILGVWGVAVVSMGVGMVVVFGNLMG